MQGHTGPADRIQIKVGGGGIAKNSGYYRDQAHSLRFSFDSWQSKSTKTRSRMKRAKHAPQTSAPPIAPNAARVACTVVKQRAGERRPEMARTLPEVVEATLFRFA